ncbi:nucleoid-associated protein [Salmonella enterica subsp. enterica]|nr:nucleoid-associated protein [Salmonella enterica subsp. enterica]
MTSLWISSAPTRRVEHKRRNRGLLQAVDDFTAEAQLDKAERQNVRQQVYASATSSYKPGKRLRLESLSKRAFRPVRVSFSRVIYREKAMSCGREHRQIAVRYARLTKYAGGGGGLTINFDAMLLGEADFLGPGDRYPDYQRDAAKICDRLQRRVGREIRHTT